MIGRTGEGVRSSDGMVVGDGVECRDDGGRGRGAVAARGSGRGRGRGRGRGGRGRGGLIAPHVMIRRTGEGIRLTDSMVVGDGRVDDDDGGRGRGAVAARGNGRGRGRSSGRGGRGRGGSIAPGGMIGRTGEGIRLLDGMVVDDGADGSPSTLDPPALIQEVSEEMTKRHARARAFALGLSFSE